jgi:hypothetical protein
LSLCYNARTDESKAGWGTFYRVSDVARPPPERSLVRDFEPDDETLVRRIGERDATAFAQLYDRHADLIYSIALRVLADPALAQDAAQDVFLRLWRNPGAYDAARGRFVSWLVSVARNRAVDEVRMRGRRRLREIGENAAVDDPPDWRAEDPQVAVQVGRWPNYRPNSGLRWRWRTFRD